MSQCIKNRLYDTVYFIGAGASAMLGAPLLADLRDKISDKEVSMLWDLYDEFGPEDFYNIIDMIDIIGIRNLDPNPDSIFRAIHKAIEDSIDLPIVNSKYHDTGSWNEVKITKCYKKIFDKNNVIVTTNYDISSERCQYNDTGSYLNKNKINYIDDDRRLIPYNHEQLDRNDDKFTILKLRGSSNFGYCEKCGMTYYFNEYEYTNLTQYDCKICTNHQKLKILIIPPTYYIAKNNDPPFDTLKIIWRSAHKFISLCRNIVFIGYSFPESDIMIRYLILNALIENNREHYLSKISVVTDNKYGYDKIEFEEKYKSIISKIIKKLPIDFYYGGFEKYCDEEIN